MQALQNDINVEEFFRRVAEAPQRALLLDYDGTLAPFRADRGAAVPYPQVVPLLNDITAMTDTRLVLISGRAIDDLLPLVNELYPLPEMWGSHGWERLDRAGRRSMSPLPKAVQGALQLARSAAQQSGFLSCCELKPSSIALHWRGVAEPDRRNLHAEAQAAWTPLLLAAEKGALELHEFDGGIELRAAGRHKGAAVSDIVTELSDDAAVAYLGDDRTDEDAFAALSGRGLGVLVRPELRETRAQLWLCPPEELVEFLTRWREAGKNRKCHTSSPTS